MPCPASVGLEQKSRSSATMPSKCCSIYSSYALKSRVLPLSPVVFIAIPLFQGLDCALIRHAQPPAHGQAVHYTLPFYILLSGFCACGAQYILIGGFEMASNCNLSDHVMNMDLILTYGIYRLST